MTLSRNKIQYILSLNRKKDRDEKKAYIIEGDKIVYEYIRAGHKLAALVALPGFIESIPPASEGRIDEIIAVSPDELKKVSSLKTPHNAIAVATISEPERDYNAILDNLVIALDCIQDPGNLGTIIRAAAWFGIKDIVCSLTCVDVYNSKVIQASMGALLNVNVHYCDLKDFIGSALGRKVPVWATMIDGEPVYELQPAANGVIIIGNESKGISSDLAAMATYRIMIPKFTDRSAGIDSLNAGMAASIILSEFSRERWLRNL